MPMKAAQVDPRYTSQLDDAPTYKVDFWDASQASAEWRIVDALDVHEVQSWCEEHRHGRDYDLYVEYRDGDDIGLARLLGFDPTGPASPAHRNPVTEFNRVDVNDALTRLVSARGSVTSAPDLSTLLLLSNRGGWAIRVVVTADGATVSTGMGSVIPVAADEDHAGPVVEVVDAIIKGDAEEYFGTGDYGPLSVIGHRVWYPGGERRALDAGAVVAATYRAVPWT